MAPRVVAGCARRYRELALDATTLRRSNAALAKALRAGKHLTRAELAAALGAAGISATGQRLAYLLQHAELAALICSGPRRGKQSTYALLDSRAPNPNPRAPLERDHALAELARRYFRSRGPATVKDFAWWSGLAAADARAGLEAVKSTLVSDVVDGETCWRTDDAPATAASPTAYVLPAFDEYLVAYRHRGLVLDPKHVKHVIGGGILGPCVVVDGRVVGTWRRVLARSTVAIAVDVFETQTRSERYAIAAAARRYAAFLGLEATIEVRTVTSRGRTLSQATPAPRRGRPRV